MHFLMLVTISLSSSATSEDARCAVHDALLNDDTFCGSGGRFGFPLCDWFVIGGRWSGTLTETLIGDAFKTALAVRFPETGQSYFPQSIAEQNQAEFDAIWTSCGGSGPNPYARTGYEELGYPDDAMRLTRELFAPLLSSFEAESIVFYGSHCEFADLDGDALSPDFVGRKWLVVVDYHS